MLFCLLDIYLLIFIYFFRVPQPVLKAKCAESLKCFAQMMEAYHETGRASLLMGVSIACYELNCLSMFLILLWGLIYYNKYFHINIFFIFFWFIASWLSCDTFECPRSCCLDRTFNSKMFSNDALFHNTFKAKGNRLLGVISGVLSRTLYYNCFLFFLERFVWCEVLKVVELWP